jgi:hypothetical protein
MMSEVAVEIPTCETCGADIRGDSLFCYSCGSALSPDAEPEAEETLEKPEAEITKRPPLTSAASLRRTRRAIRRRAVQISWDPPDGQPTAFFIAAIALTIGAAILLVLAMYLR